MATIVTHKAQGGRFAVLGGSYTQWEKVHHSGLLDIHWLSRSEGNARILVVCGADGVIQFGRADEFTVLTIDGRSPAEVLAEGGG